MTLQSTVRFNTAGGVVGELAFDGPHRAESGTLSADASIGLVVSQDNTTGKWAPGAISGTKRFGVLINPKDKVLRGTTVGGPLAPSLVLAANTQGTVCTMGQVWVQTATATAKPGDVVYVTDATGAITTTVPGAAAPGASTLLPGAWVAPLPIGATTPGLIVITINGAPVAAPVA